MTVRVAVTGVSHWHAIYDPAYLHQLKSMPDVAVVGVQDQNLEIASLRATEIDGCRAFADYREMITVTRPDFVLALGRHCDMAAIGLHLVEQRLPFMMEKPMGVSAAEVLQLSQAAKAHNVFAAIPMVQRFSPFYRKALSLMESATFGPLSHVYVRMNRFSSERYRRWNSEWMLDPALSGGGSLRNLGAHGFDVFLNLLGEDFEITAAQTSNLALGEKVEDYASVQFRTRSGILGTLETGNAYPRRTTEGTSTQPSQDRFLDGADDEWKICGRDAFLMAKDGVLRLVTRDAEETFSGRHDVNPSYIALTDALTRWRAGQQPLASAHDCWRCAALIDEAYRLAHSGISRRSFQPA